MDDAQEREFQRLDGLIAHRLGCGRFDVGRFQDNVTGICYFNSDIIALLSLPWARRRAFERRIEHLQTVAAHAGIIERINSSSTAVKALKRAQKYLRRLNAGAGLTPAEETRLLEAFVELAIVSIMYRIADGDSDTDRTYGTESLIQALYNHRAGVVEPTPGGKEGSTMLAYTLGITLAPKLEFLIHEQFMYIANHQRHVEDLIFTPGRAYVLTAIQIVVQDHVVSSLRYIRESDLARLANGMLDVNATRRSLPCFYMIDQDTNNAPLTQSAYESLALMNLRLGSEGDVSLIYLPIDAPIPSPDIERMQTTVYESMVSSHRECPRIRVATSNGASTISPGKRYTISRNLPTTLSAEGLDFTYDINSCRPVHIHVTVDLQVVIMPRVYVPVVGLLEAAAYTRIRDACHGIEPLERLSRYAINYSSPERCDAVAALMERMNFPRDGYSSSVRWQLAYQRLHEIVHTSCSPVPFIVLVDRMRGYGPDVSLYVPAGWRAVTQSDRLALREITGLSDLPDREGRLLYIRPPLIPGVNDRVSFPARAETFVDTIKLALWSDQRMLAGVLGGHAFTFIGIYARLMQLPGRPFTELTDEGMFTRLLLEALDVVSERPPVYEDEHADLYDSYNNPIVTNDGETIVITPRGL